MGSGAGLGLSIVEAIMRAHGGLAVLEAPAHERGARFTLRLPPLADAD
jgi:signal transduction histidine kinase